MGSTQCPYQVLYQPARLQPEQCKLWLFLKDRGNVLPQMLLNEETMWLLKPVPDMPLNTFIQ